MSHVVCLCTYVTNNTFNNDSPFEPSTPQNTMDPKSLECCLTPLVAQPPNASSHSSFLLSMIPPASGGSICCYHAGSHPPPPPAPQRGNAANPGKRGSCSVAGDPADHDRPAKQGKTEPPPPLPALLAPPVVAMNKWMNNRAGLLQTLTPSAVYAELASLGHDDALHWLAACLVSMSGRLEPSIWVKEGANETNCRTN